MMKRYPFVTLALFSLLSVNAWGIKADKDTYQVEVIVFENMLDAGAKSEIFAHHEPLPEIDKATLLDEEDANNPLFSLLSESKMRLLPETKKLSRQPAYRLLLHTAWLQKREVSKLIRIENQPQSQDSPHIDGTINVTQGRHYYNLSVHLSFTPKLGFLEKSPKPFILKQKRRVKSDEISYLDHPKFGVLVLIHPVMS
jgi:hypothetical protein